MNRSRIFLAGVGCGALALGLAWAGWESQVSVAPSAPMIVEAAPAPATAAVPPVELPSAQVPRADTPAPALPHPAVVVAPPSQPELGELPVDDASPPAPAAPMVDAAPVADVAPASPPVAALSLLIPVDGVTAAQLSDTFTDARGEGRLHDAIDIMAPTGTPVRAVADGRVAKLFTSKAGGLTVYQFDGTDTMAFYYAHLDRYADGLKEGQVLRQGDLVGYVGFTGNASPDGPHLHFAIMVLGPEKKWWQGTAINPYPHFRR